MNKAVELSIEILKCNSELEDVKSSISQGKGVFNIMKIASVSGEINLRRDELISNLCNYIIDNQSIFDI